MATEDSFRVKAHKAVDDARVAAHEVVDDAKVAVSNAIDDVKIEAHKAGAEAKKNIWTEKKRRSASYALRGVFRGAAFPAHPAGYLPLEALSGQYYYHPRPPSADHRRD